MRQKILTMLVCASVVGAGAGSAAQGGEAEAMLAGAAALRCTFPMSVRTTWKGAEPVPVVRRTGNLVVNIRNINPASGSAATTTGTGNKDLTMIVNGGNRYFLDAGGGRVTLTMVFGEFSTGTKFKAAQSVHDYVAIDIASFRSEPDVLQYWGDCEIAPPQP